MEFEEFGSNLISDTDSCIKKTTKIYYITLKREISATPYMSSCCSPSDWKQLESGSSICLENVQPYFTKQIPS